MVSKPLVAGPTREECLALLASVSVGRIALSIESLPVVLPVAFALLDDDVVFRAPLEAKLLAAVVGVVLAFQADEFEGPAGAGWSVLVQGQSRSVVDPVEIDACRALGLPAFDAESIEQHFARLATTRLTGRRFSVPSR